MMQRVFRHVQARAALLIGVMGVSAFVAAQRPAPASHSRTGLAALLGAASHAQVDDAQLVWEPSRGVVLDLLSGRGLFFVARSDAAALRDVFHACVRVSPSGQPLAVAGVRNLTQTPLVDDTGLQGTGRYAAFASLSEGLVRSATLLDAAGAFDTSASWLMRARRSVTDYWQTRRLGAIARKDVELKRPSASLTMALAPGELRLTTAEAEMLVLDLATRALKTQDALQPASLAGGEWQASPGQQPAPAEDPGILESTVKLGLLQVRLVSFDRGRLNWRLRAGEREPTVAGQRPAKYQLSTAEHARALLAMNLGHATVGTDYGMAFQGSSSLPLRGDRATLIVPEQGVLRLLQPGEPIELRASDAAVQLPVLIAEGEIMPQASSRGSRTLRAGLCVLPSERLLMALAHNDSSDVLALALQMQGCRNAVELDRGSHHGAFLHRLGTAEPPLAAYATSVLFGLDQP